MLLQKIQSQGILAATEMIVGTDGDTPESIKQTAVFIEKSRIPAPKFYVLTPLPGTEFYKQMKEEGRLLHEDYTKYTSTKCVYSPANFTADELDMAYWRLYKKTYSLRNVFKRTLFSPYFYKAPRVYLFMFFVNMVYRKYIRNGDAPNIL